MWALRSLSQYRCCLEDFIYGRYGFHNAKHALWVNDVLEENHVAELNLQKHCFPRQIFINRVS